MSGVAHHFIATIWPKKGEVVEAGLSDGAERVLEKQQHHRSFFNYSTLNGR
jgi:hypothetical protein